MSADTIPEADLSLSETKIGDWRATYALDTPDGRIELAQFGATPAHALERLASELHGVIGDGGLHR